MPQFTASSHPRVLIIMGVSGSGKSEVGSALAKALGGVFHDADSFHPAANVAKMSAGIPLNDEDRKPWLEKMRREIILGTPTGETAVLACSALKKAYREYLREGQEDVWMVYLKGSFELILERISARQGHFMKADLLRSQFATMEEPTDEPRVIIADIDAPISQIVSGILRALGRSDCWSAWIFARQGQRDVEGDVR